MQEGTVGRHLWRDRQRPGWGQVGDGPAADQEGLLEGGPPSVCSEGAVRPEKRWGGGLCQPTPPPRVLGAVCSVFYSSSGAAMLDFDTGSPGCVSSGGHRVRKPWPPLSCRTRHNSYSASGSFSRSPVAPQMAESAK